MQRSIGIAGAVLGAALLVGLVACSGRGAGSPSGLPPLESTTFGHRVPGSSATPPVTAPVTIPYPYTNHWTTKTWAGPSASPMPTTGSDDGVITVNFALDKKSGIYDVLERIKSKLGYTENLDSAIGFLPHDGGIAQIILSDDYTYVAGPFDETGMDTYPQGENSFDFPLTTGRRWSAAAAHTSYVNEYLSGKGAFAENDAYTETAVGTYQGQTSYSNLHGGKIQDNYASTTDVANQGPSVYTLSERAAGYNKLTQIFELPNDNFIAVRSKGRAPLPYKRGTVKVPDWYPAGRLPSQLYSDRFDVVGPASMPSLCGKRAGQASTEVLERFANLDPVQGFYNTYESWYYLAQLAPGQYWFGCIVEKYRNETYANGWVMSPGDWGGLSSQQIGTEVLIASSVKDDAIGHSPPQTWSATAARSPGSGSALVR
ncbi:MAG: hypothetical protein JOZ77_04725 [Candidatus Eremiobacteraeota bacterium]|nr:hypothetical protein [Candidatus Eremiobacteraeota bacterium]